MQGRVEGLALPFKFKAFFICLPGQGSFYKGQGWRLYGIAGGHLNIK